MIKPFLRKGLFALPNLLSIFRLISTLYVIYLIINERFSLASWVVFCACLTDWADGFLARLMHSESQFGALIDPLADKIFIMGISIALCLINYLPNWVMALFIMRDAFLIIGGGWILWKNAPIPLKPVLISKINTFLQMGLVLLILWANIPLETDFLISTDYVSNFFNNDMPHPLSKALLGWIGLLSVVTTIISAFAYLNLFLYYKKTNTHKDL